MSFDKSELFFSANVHPSKQNTVCSVLRVNSNMRKERYLGLPSTVGRKKKEAFGDLKERVLRKVSSWSSRMLPVGNKEVLIKAVL